MNGKKAIIIGAGPAGLTAACELLARANIRPIIFELEREVGGICRTVDVDGNKMDLGGHRFFSKSDLVMNWWQSIFPVRADKGDIRKSDDNGGDKVFLVRDRVSRIYYAGSFFDYPLSLSAATISRLGFTRTAKIALGYFHSRLFKIKEESSLEDFLINRFGRELYQTFFKDYTEKLWGVDCSKIKPDWGAQRIKGVSLSGAVVDALKKKLGLKKPEDTETSLIERFLYPKLGPGQFWGEVAKKVKKMGGKIYLETKVIKVLTRAGKVEAVTTRDKSGKERVYRGDYFISSMPIRDLIASFDRVPKEARVVADGLIYRDFITVGVLAKKLRIGGKGRESDPIKDNWIYIQDPQVRMCRLQIFNNWSPYLVADRRKIWLGLEYVCDKGDKYWEMEDEEFADFAVSELETIGALARRDVVKTKVVRVQKAYPAYFGSYDQIDVIRNYTDKFKNLYLIGRNGMHRYNNMDHSMLTAMAAVDNIISRRSDKDNIWRVNAEKEYHERKGSCASNL